jgi:4-amino-4-deoxy-L-arabinose transferase-like glycosyltransferase
MKRVLKFLLAHKYTLYVLSVVFTVWVVVYLNTLSIPIIQQWDEARNAINTQEMLQNGHWLVRYFEGQPETWELKPPFLIWTQCLSTGVLGMTEFGIRFPSALAALGIAIITLLFLIQEGMKPITAGVCATMLITLPAALHPHGFLFGDHDAMLCFFQALMLVSQYRFFKTGKSFWVWIAALAFLLGWLTKSIAVCFVLPGIFMMGIIDAEYRKRLFSVKQIAAYSAALTIITAYYLARNHYQPGYTDLVNQEEWLGRFAQHPDANNDIFYYLKGFYKERLQGFVFPALLAFCWSLYRWKKQSFSAMGCMIILFTLPIISMSQSKNFWYDLPLLFPIALCMARLLNDLFHYSDQKLPKSSLIIGALLILIITKNAVRMVGSHDHSKNLNKKEITIQYLKTNRFSTTEKYGVYCNAFNTDIRFYLNNLNRKGYNFSIAEPGNHPDDFSTIIMAKEDEASWKSQKNISGTESKLIVLGR